MLFIEIIESIKENTLEFIRLKCLKQSAESIGRHFLKKLEPFLNLMEMLVFNSRIRRSRIAREVTCLPSLPASGPSLIENCICTVGGSISTNGSGCTSGEPASVSPISTLSMPAATPTMPPAVPPSESCVARPE